MWCMGSGTWRMVNSRDAGKSQGKLSLMGEVFPPNLCAARFIHDRFILDYTSQESSGLMSGVKIWIIML